VIRLSRPRGTVGRRGIGQRDVEAPRGGVGVMRSTREHDVARWAENISVKATFHAFKLQIFGYKFKFAKNKTCTGTIGRPIF
jgi:hypothetical protein